MPNSKNNRRGPESIRRSQKSSSFHGRVPAMMPAVQLRRPKTLPDLHPNQAVVTVSPEARPKLTKLLLNVTIQGSVGAVQVVMSPEQTVVDLVAATVRQYVKECRRPNLPATDASGFDLHYSQFSLESLEKSKKLMELGSRNFFLHPTKTTSSSSCSKEAEKASKAGIPWLKFMDFSW